MARVLILREAGAALETAQALAARGHEPLLLPLEAIIRLADTPPTTEVSGFVVTSAAAVPALAEAFPRDPRPLFAVGEASARAARTAGFPDVAFGAGSAATLAPVVTARCGHGPTSAPLLYAAGRNRSGSLEAAFGAGGIPFVAWEVYDIAPRRPEAAEIAAILAGGPVDAVLLLSQGQAARFGALSASFESESGLPRCLCLSARIAEALDEGLKGAAEISQAPRLPQLFETLERPSLPRRGR